MPPRLCRWLSVCALLITTAAANAQDEFKPRPFDWPQWQGPSRNAMSKETGLLQMWPENGPKLLWKIDTLGESFSTPSIAAGRIFTMGNVDGKEYAFALKEKDGSLLWKVALADVRRVGHSGTRSTPTVDGDRVYVLCVQGRLACLRVGDGKIIWSRDLVKDFGGRPGGWRYAESILIDGEKLLCTPGGKSATMLALNKADGDVVWKCAMDVGYSAGYSSIIAVEVDGLRQYVQFVGRGGRGGKGSKGAVVGVRAKDGKMLWSFDDPGNRTANISTPIFSENFVFAASAYRTGGALASLTRNGDNTDAKVVYFTEKMQNHHGGMILLDGYLYGSNGGRMACIHFKTGKLSWESRTPGKGSIFHADGRIYYRHERSGNVYLIEPDPKKYVQRGMLRQPNRSGRQAWAHPIVANGRLYIADQTQMFCYDVKKSK